MKKIIILVIAVFIMLTVMTGCETEADRVSYNLSQQADNFNIVRQLTVINCIEGDVLFQMTGKLSITSDTYYNQLEIIVEDNGTYVNPILNADYSDPDAIRVGDKYYMVASDFHFMGMQMLESDDLVNWTLISKVYDRINLSQYDEMDAYGEGSWAPALRYHDGKFWVFFCTPYDGLFMTTATDPHGPWAPLHHVKDVDNWEDPCNV